MPSPIYCPECQRPVSMDLGGLCPYCLWGASMETVQGNGIVPGHILGPELARGGMGIVYQAREISPDRAVAIKMLLPHLIEQPTMKERFCQEAQAAAGLEHPGILPVYQVGESQGMPWFSMKLVTGGTLAERKPKLIGQWRVIAQLMAQAAAAVHHAHERGVLHRDLKPANLLFDEKETLFISDFGLARMAWQDESSVGLTQSLQMLGTPAYLAPEVAGGSMKAATTASDIYALGAILYELLSGRTPFLSDSMQGLLRKIVDDSVPSLRGKSLPGPAVPGDLLAIMEKCLEKSPAVRYASAGALAQDLQSWLDGRTVMARPVGMGGQLKRWAQRRPAVAALSAALLLGTVAGVLLQWRTNRRLQASLNDAEARVEFMTRELPTALAPVGRLDLLDSVFQNVADHYIKNPSSEPAQLARQADFLSQWSQILRPRGQVKEALLRLETALATAKAATAGTRILPIEIALARMLAGWRMGEALIEDRQFERAESVLTETQAFAAAQRTNDLRFRVLVAQLTLEPAYLELARGQADQALPVVEASLRQWAAIKPLLEKQIASPANQLALVAGAGVHTMLATVYHALGNAEAEHSALQQGLAESEKLLGILPDNPHFRSLRVSALNIASHALTTTPEQQRHYYEEADQLSRLLLMQDPTNLRWRTDAVMVAKELSELAANANDRDGQRRWVEIAADRLKPLYQTYSTDLKYLTARGAYANFCGNYYRTQDWEKNHESGRLHESDDWKEGVFHLHETVRTLQLIYQLDPTDTNRDTLERFARDAVEKIKASSGEEAADKWLAEFKVTPKP